LAFTRWEIPDLVVANLLTAIPLPFLFQYYWHESLHSTKKNFQAFLLDDFPILLPGDINGAATAFSD